MLHALVALVAALSLVVLSTVLGVLALDRQASRAQPLWFRRALSAMVAVFATFAAYSVSEAVF